MDTAQVAQELGTTARTLRVFLRSQHSTFVPVGSGARYDFTEREIPTIRKRFEAWQSAGKPRPSAPVNKPEEKQPRKAPKLSARDRRDREVWAEEGEVKLPDIRDPKVRARALRDARAAEDRLMLRLMAAGLHITQLGDKK